MSEIATSRGPNFPSVKAAVNAYHGAEYQAALAALGDGARCDIRIV